MMRGEELLALLLYGLDIAASPSLSAVTQDGERWRRYQASHRNQLHRLQKNGMVERGEEGGRWAIALTERGRLRALGGRDPEVEWGRGWDGRWRMLMFDLESGNEARRRMLLRWLHSVRFGCLQKSVWLRPDACSELGTILEKLGAASESVLVFEGKPAVPHVSDEAIATSSWDFGKINSRHQSYQDFVSAGLPGDLGPEAARDWCKREAALWKAAVAGDPLLPEVLLPEGYLGKRSWAARRRLMRRAGEMVIALEADPDR